MIRWTPSGTLDVNTDPAELPIEASGKNAASGAMTRCTNLHLDSTGIASTRFGSKNLNTTVTGVSISEIIEQGGVRYSFGGGKIFKNEEQIKYGLETDRWSAMLYNAYNSIDEDIFCLNGTDRRRIHKGVVYEWGIDAPTVKPTLRKYVDFAATYAWEDDDAQIDKILTYTGENTWAYTHDWEDDYITSGDIGFCVYRIQIGDYNSKGYACWDYESTGLQQYVVASTIDDYINVFTLVENTYYCTTSWEEEWIDNRNQDFEDIYSTRYMFQFEKDSNGTQTGKYRVVYTYCRKYNGVLECESNPSPSFAVNNHSGIGVTYTQPTDAQVTHIRFYRTLEDQEDYYYHSEIAKTKLYTTLCLRDEELGTEVEYDHDRPPKGTICFGPTYDGTCFIIKGNNLYYSKTKRPEYWPLLNYIEVSPVQFPIRAGAILSGQAYVATDSEIYQIQGTQSSTFFPLPMGAVVGTRAEGALKPVMGKGVFHIGPDGVYQFRVGQDTKVTQNEFNTLFQGITRGSVPHVDRSKITKCWIIPFQNKLYFAYCSTSDTYPSNMLVTDFGSNKTVHYQYPFEMRCACVDFYNKRLLVGCEDGYVRVIESTTYLDDSGTSITWDVETMEFNQLSKYFPRYARYDVNLQTHATATGYIKLDGSNKQTHPITESRQTRKRLVTGCNGDRLSVRITGTGNVSIYGAEVE